MLSLPLHCVAPHASGCGNITKRSREALESQWRKRVRFAQTNEMDNAGLAAVSTFAASGGLLANPPSAPNEAAAEASGTVASDIVSFAEAEARAAAHDEIHELLDLAESDLPVRWPRGWNLDRARRARLYTTTTSEGPAR